MCERANVERKKVLFLIHISWSVKKISQYLQNPGIRKYLSWRQQDCVGLGWLGIRSGTASIKCVWLSSRLDPDADLAVRILGCGLKEVEQSTSLFYPMRFRAEQH